MIIVVCGVTGSGKSTIGKKLSEKFNFEFADGDDYHSEENKILMRNGIGLNDELRLGWLIKLRQILFNWFKSNKNGILACSALKQKYRNLLNSNLLYNQNQQERDLLNLNLMFIMLDFDRYVIESRLNKRSDHAIIKDLTILDSQFECLEKVELNPESTILKYKNSYLNREASAIDDLSYLIYVYRPTELEVFDPADVVTDNIVHFLRENKQFFQDFFKIYF